MARAPHIRRVGKFAMAERHRQHAGRARSPENVRTRAPAMRRFHSRFPLVPKVSAAPWERTEQRRNSVEVIHQFPPGGFDIGNRFKQWVIPALREVMNGARQEDVDVPNLHDGLAAQLFTDAVAESAKRGTWVEPGARAPSGGSVVAAC